MFNEVAINTGALGKEYTLAEVIEKSAMAGFRVLDFDLYVKRRGERFSEDDISNALNLAKKFNIRFESGHGFFSFGCELTAEDDAIRKESLERAKHDIDTAKALGLKRVIFHLSHHPKEAQLEALKKNAVVALGALLEHANGAVDIAVENMPREMCNAIVFHALDALPKLKVCFDSGHANLLGDEDVFFSKYLKRIACVHLHDNNGEEDRHFVPFDDGGSVDWKRYIGALSQASVSTLMMETLFYKNEAYSESDVFLKRVYSVAKRLVDMQ